MKWIILLSALLLASFTCLPQSTPTFLSYTGESSTPLAWGAWFLSIDSVGIIHFEGQRGDSTYVFTYTPDHLRNECQVDWESEVDGTWLYHVETDADGFLIDPSVNQRSKNEKTSEKWPDNGQP